MSDKSEEKLTENIETTESPETVNEEVKAEEVQKEKFIDRVKKFFVNCFTTVKEFFKNLFKSKKKKRAEELEQEVHVQVQYLSEETKEEDTSDNLIEIKNLKKYFYVPAGTNHAVDDITMTIKRGRTMGVVGESGCGKSTLGRTIIRLHDATSGHIYLEGKEITDVKGKDLRAVREKMQIIFQDPYASLNPRYSIDEVIREPLQVSKRYAKSEIDERVSELMDRVGVEERLRYSYPHELDGGRRQRIGIARSIALNPDFILCDEPVSALDVSIQAQVLNLLMDLQEEKKLTYMFVTHDLSVVKHISDDISVMYLGQLVETSPAKRLFESPLHPYTKALLSAIPSTDIDHPMQRILLKGEITSAINPQPGCRFAKRCPYAKEECLQPQVLQEVEPNHFVSCCRVKEVN